MRHNSMYGYENNRNSLVYRYTRTAPCQLMKLWTEKLPIATKKKSTITLIIPAEVGSGHSRFCSYLLPLLDKS